MSEKSKKISIRESLRIRMWTQTSWSVGLQGMLLRGYQVPHRTWVRSVISYLWARQPDPRSSAEHPVLEECSLTPHPHLY